MSDVFLACFYSILAGAFIELFFKLVKYRDSLNTNSPRSAIDYNHVSEIANYLSCSQYLSGGQRKWLNYYLFRLLPPFIIMILLSGVFSRYLNISSTYPFLFLAAIVSLIPRDIICLFKKKRISERLLHSANILLVCSCSFIVWVISSFINMSFFAPSTQGLIDNLWSSLTVAVLVLFYFQITNMGTHNQEKIAEDVVLSNYIVKAYSRINKLYDAVIQRACLDHKCSLPILYSVLIYEDMNRPEYLRVFENWLVRIFHFNLTVGIAQIRSKKPLSDKDSIKEAAIILKNTKGASYCFNDIKKLESVLANYNQSDIYAKSIAQILYNLAIYACDLFDKDNV